MELGEEVGGHALGGAELAAKDHGLHFGWSRDQDFDRIFVLLEILLFDELAAEGDEEVIARGRLARREVDHLRCEALDSCRTAAGFFEQLFRGMRGSRFVIPHAAGREFVDEVVDRLLVLANDDELAIRRERHDGVARALGELRILLDLAGLGVDEVLGSDGQAVTLHERTSWPAFFPLLEIGFDDGSQIKVLRFLRHVVGARSEPDFSHFVNPASLLRSLLRKEEGK